MRQLRQRVGKSAGANIVNRQNRIVHAELPATIDDFLRAPFHFRIGPLHRIEIQRFLIRTGVHARCGAAAEADQQARPAELNEQRAATEFFLFRMVGVDLADATGDHDRLVVTAHLAIESLFETAKITGEIRPAEFVVERCSADRAVDHNLQRRRDA